MRLFIGIDPYPRKFLFVRLEEPQKSSSLEINLMVCLRQFWINCCDCFTGQFFISCKCCNSKLQKCKDIELELEKDQLKNAQEVTLRKIKYTEHSTRNNLSEDALTSFSLAYDCWMELKFYDRNR